MYVHAYHRISSVVTVYRQISPDITSGYSISPDIAGNYRILQSSIFFVSFLLSLLRFLLAENLILDLKNFTGSLLFAESDDFQVGFYVGAFPVFKFPEDNLFQVFEPFRTSYEVLLKK